MLHRLLFLFGADVFALPRVDFDLHPGTMAFMIFCGALTAGVLVGILALGLYGGEDEQDLADRNERNLSGDDADDDVEPFIPSEAQPDVSESVTRLFDEGERSGTDRDEPAAFYARQS
jgi:hypothetical protein